MPGQERNSMKPLREKTKNTHDDQLTKNRHTPHGQSTHAEQLNDKENSYGHNSHGGHEPDTATPDATNTRAYEQSFNAPPEDELSNGEEEFAENPGEGAQLFETTHTGQVTGQNKTVRP